MNNDLQQDLDRIKAEDEANDKAVDRIHVEMAREYIHDNLEMLPPNTRRKLETVETMFHSAEDIYGMFMKECFLSLLSNN